MMGSGWRDTWCSRRTSAMTNRSKLGLPEPESINNQGTLCSHGSMETKNRGTFCHPESVATNNRIIIPRRNWMNQFCGNSVAESGESVFRRAIPWQNQVNQFSGAQFRGRIRWISFQAGHSVAESGESAFRRAIPWWNWRNLFSERFFLACNTSLFTSSPPFSDLIRLRHLLTSSALRAPSPFGEGKRTFTFPGEGRSIIPRGS